MVEGVWKHHICALMEMCLCWSDQVIINSRCIMTLSLPKPSSQALCGYKLLRCFFKNFRMLALMGVGSVYGAKWDGVSIFSYLHSNSNTLQHQRIRHHSKTRSKGQPVETYQCTHECFELSQMRTNAASIALTQRLQATSHSGHSPCFVQTSSQM